MRKDITRVELIYHSDLDKTILYIYKVAPDALCQHPTLTSRYEIPKYRPRKIRAISAAVFRARFTVRPLLAGNVGWAAWPRVTV